MKKLLAGLLILVLIPSCKSRKAATRNPEMTELSTDIRKLGEQVNTAAFEFEYLSIKAGGRFEGLGMQQNISLNIRMKRHEKVWISAQALLGIEVARALVTRDSVYIIQNLPSRDYREYSLDSFSSVLSVPLSVTQLQDLLVGNPLLPYDNSAMAAMQGDSLVVEKQIRDFLLREFFAPGKARIARNYLQSKRESGHADVHYSDFSLEGTKELPLKVNIFVQRQESKARLDLQYTSISLDPIGSFPFRRPVD